MEAWTLELGSGMRVKEESVKKGVRGIINYLTYKNILKLELIKPQNKTKFVLKNNLKHYYAPQGGIIRNRLQAGAKIQQGDTLYQLLTFEKKRESPL